MILEVALQTEEARPVLLVARERFVAVRVVDGCERAQASRDLVASGYTNAPCIFVRELVAYANVTEVLSGRGDRELLGCLDCVFSSNGPLRTVVVVVRVGGVFASDAERARAEFSRCEDAESSFFSVEVVGSEAVDVEASDRCAELAGNAEAVVRVVVGRVGTAFDFFNRNASEERTAVVGVTSRVLQSAERRVERVGFARQAVVPPAVEVTDVEASDVDPCAVEEGVAVSVSLDVDVGRQSAEFGVVLRFDRQVTAAVSVYVAVVADAEAVIVDFELGTNVTTDLEAGFRAGDVKVARAESVANAMASAACAPDTAARAAAEPRRRLLMFISDLQSKV
ncbi:hypothetical protein ASG58_03990 [Rhizobium sp. Leaf383]|nr:hypothetical protein ASG58_03990 [Rhizobium sp. Leaf383]